MPTRARTVAAGLLVVVVLLVPGVAGEPPSPSITVPVEAALVALLLLVVPDRARSPLATAAGVLLGLGTVWKLVDLGFFAALAMPFDPLAGWELFGNGYDFLRGSLGPVGAALAAVAAVLIAATVVAATTWAARSLTTLIDERRPVGIAGLSALAVVLPLLVIAPTGSGIATARVRGVADAIADRGRFAAQLGVDPYAGVRGTELLTGLAGHDVVIAFVESYGRSAVETAGLAEPIRAELDAGTRRLAAAGFSARSGYLTSSTFGGRSWLAHASLLTGTWVDSQQRYRQLLDSDRLSLNRAFGRAGWRTVGVSPGTTGDWPDGAFYGFDAFYDSRNLGYRGPNFSWATMPDQYTLAAFQRLERDRRTGPPVMAELQLVSSHAPWSPTPSLLEWSRVGDGSVYDGMADADDPAAAILTRDPARVRADYVTSVRYSLASLVSYLETHGDRELVLILLGDHQPNPIVTGPGATADVPVTIVTGDPAVLARTDGWGWSSGLRPEADAPVWRMDAFRDRFLAAFGPVAGTR